MASAQTALYVQDRAKEAYTKGALGGIANLELFQDQNVQAHTTGTFTTGSTPLERREPKHNLCVVRRYQHAVADHRRLGGFDVGS